MTAGGWAQASCAEAALARWLAAAYADGICEKSVLVIGAGSEVHAEAAARLGAGRVAALLSPDDGAAPREGNAVQWLLGTVYDLGALASPFDLVIVTGGLERLRHPLFALDLIGRHAARETLIVEIHTRGAKVDFAAEDDYPFVENAVFSAAGFPAMTLDESQESGSEGWMPNLACARALLRASGFAIAAEPTAGVFVCRRLPAAAHCQEALAALAWPGAPPRP